MDNEITILKARAQLIPLREISKLFNIRSKRILNLESKYLRKAGKDLKKYGPDCMKHDEVSLYNTLSHQKKKRLI